MPLLIKEGKASVSRIKRLKLDSYLSNFNLNNELKLFPEKKQQTRIEAIDINRKTYHRFINEFWTSKQRQASSIHEISYRACFKPQLPRFFIELFSKENDIIYDPFSGRGTTIIEAGLLNRNIISNDINPLSKILSYPRFFIPNLQELKERLEKIKIYPKKANIDLNVFYHPKTENEIVSLRDYLEKRKNLSLEDNLDHWIRMIATNRLTGHSKGFFSVYTLPPNQAVTIDAQLKINKKRKQKPEYRNTKKIIFKKTKDLIRNLKAKDIGLLKKTGEQGHFLTCDVRNTNAIKKESVQLTITSPPFLDVVQYANDNWLRCWFNNLPTKEISKKITVCKKIDDWSNVMSGVFKELFRVTKKGGWVAFEVGEVRNGSLKLDEYIIPLGLKAEFHCKGVLVNEQIFTKTSNIWGINNNNKGTNSNRVVIFQKEKS